MTASGADLPPAPPSRPAPAPVFVDPSGRRHRHMRRVGYGVAALVLAYVLATVASLFGAPGLTPIDVPGVGPLFSGPRAPQLSDLDGRRADPARVLATTTATPAPRPTALPPAVTARPTGAATRTPGATVTPAPIARTPQSTNAATPAPLATRTTQPGQGATQRATPKARPTRTSPGKP